MAIMVSEPKSTPAPEGVWRFVCVDVVDMPNTETPHGIKDFVRLVLQIEEYNDETDRPFFVSRRYGATLHKNSTLRGEIEGWRGKKFTREELDGFDLEAVIGDTGQVQVFHKEADDGRIWANVKAIIPLAKGSEPLAPWPGYVRVCDRPDDDGNGRSNAEPKPSAKAEPELEKAGLGL